MRNQLASGIPLIGKNLDYLPVAMMAMRRLQKDSPEKFIENKVDGNPFDSDDERRDLIERAEWLCEKVIVEPQKLIDAMPAVIGRSYQGEWAIYACSMTIFALSNIIRLYPDTKDRYLPKIAEIVEIIKTPEIKWYDANAFHEDPLESLDGNKSHMTYLSILAWSMTNYRIAGGDNRYDGQLSALCDALARRMEQSYDLNLPSFPNGVIFLPDMMFTIIALKNYGRIFNNEYDELVGRWMDNARTKWIHRPTGLLLSQYYGNRGIGVMQGSYAALNCTCLCLIDEAFAREQYELLKQTFAKFGKYCGIMEYLSYSGKPLDFHIDAGPIIYGLSPSGISFAMGAATYFGDWQFRKGLLNSAELAGKTIRRKGRRHYKLADIMLTGEAITLAMRTTIR